MKKLTIILSMAVLTLSVQADCTPKWCNSKKGFSTAEQYVCSSKILGSADTLLNEIYAQVMEFKGKEGQEGMWAGEVKGAQLNWIKQRNKIDDEEEVLASYMGRIDTLYSTLKVKQTHGTSIVYENIKKVHTAVVNNKSEALVHLMVFPKTITIDGKATKFKDEKDFLKAYSKIFTKKYREIVAKSKPNKKDMMQNYRGIMLGSGSIWFDEEGHVISLNTKF